MGREFLGERNAKKANGKPRGITDVKSVNKAFECHSGEETRYPNGCDAKIRKKEKQDLRGKAEKGMGNPIDPG